MVIRILVFIVFSIVVLSIAALVQRRARPRSAAEQRRERRQKRREQRLARADTPPQEETPAQPAAPAFGAPQKPTAGDVGPGGLLAGLPSAFQKMVDSSTTTTTTTSYSMTTGSIDDDSLFEFTDEQGKVHSYSSIEQMPESVKAMFEEAIGQNEPGRDPAQITIPRGVNQTRGGSSTEEADDEPATRSGPRSRDSRERHQYIPLEPEQPNDDPDQE